MKTKAPRTRYLANMSTTDMKRIDYICKEVGIEGKVNGVRLAVVEQLKHLDEDASPDPLPEKGSKKRLKFHLWLSEEERSNNRKLVAAYSLSGESEACRLAIKECSRRLGGP